MAPGVNTALQESDVDRLDERRTRIVLLIARCLMASLAAFGALEKVWDYNGASGFAAAFNIPFAHTLMPLAIVLELTCAVFMVTERYCRIGASILAVWTFVLGVWFHRFWAVPADQWQMMIDSFFHHFVMVGGFIYVAIFGATPGIPRQAAS